MNRNYINPLNLFNSNRYRISCWIYYDSMMNLFLLNYMGRLWRQHFHIIRFILVNSVRNRMTRSQFYNQGVHNTVNRPASYCASNYNRNHLWINGSLKLGYTKKANGLRMGNGNAAINRYYYFGVAGVSVFKLSCINFYILHYVVSQYANMLDIVRPSLNMPHQYVNRGFVRW